MPDERGPECQKECTQLAVLRSKMEEVEKQLGVIFPKLTEARSTLEQLSNYREWRGDVSDSLGQMREFIVRQDTRAADLAEHLAAQKANDELRRQGFRWKFGLISVLIVGLL